MRSYRQQGASALLVALAATHVAALQPSDYTLNSTKLNRTAWENQPYVSNGYIGQRLPAEGFGYLQSVPTGEQLNTQGWPLFTPRQTAATVAGFYDQQNETAGTNFAQTGGQQPISTLPTWSTILVTVNNQTFSQTTDASQISNWSQSMSVQDGIVTTKYDWTPSLGGSNSSTNSSSTNSTSSKITLSYTIFAHKVIPTLGAVYLSVSGLTNQTQVAFTDVLDGRGAWRTDPVSQGPVPNTTYTIHSAVRPHGISNVTAYEVSLFSSLSNISSWAVDAGANCAVNGALSSNASTASQCYRPMSVPANGKLEVVKYVGIASSDAYPGAELSTALKSAQNANSTGWTALVKSHQDAWAQVWNDADITIPGQEHADLQIATRASMFHLITNVRNGSEPHGLGDNSIAPAGLTSDSYAGQIFWDADTWMFPSLLAMWPDYAESIVDFRYRQLGAAQVNAAKYNLSGALYPWTGARFGNCTGVGPCYDYEYHLNSDIALAAWQYYASTKNQTWLAQKGYPLVRNLADMFASFVTFNQTSGMYSTLNETSPDEYSNHKNNSAMINGALTVTLEQAKQLGSVLGQQTPSNWSQIQQDITILKAQSGILLEFDGFNGTTPVKQADVVLLTYPYGYLNSSTQSLANLDFYSLATSPNGPGMTYSIFSIIAASVSPVGCASWSYLLQASQPYARAPFYQFSEQTNDNPATNGGTNPAYTFLTGHGGYLQTLTHGYTGYRSNLDYLYLDPNLPPQLTNYTIHGFKWGGSSFDINVATNQTTITRKSGGNDTITVQIAQGNPMAGAHSLAANGTLSVPTRMVSGSLVEGNIAQCKTVMSNDTAFGIENSPIVPGEFALAAIDGANATTWQPINTSPATLTVDLGAVQPIKGFHFNWGSVPPRTYSVSVTNSSSMLNSTSMSGSSNSTMMQSAAAVVGGNVTLSAPFDAVRANMVAIPLGNLTDAPVPQGTVSGRYVSLTISGSYGTDGYGGTVAEFAVLGA
ncbi:hypothetical protein JCM10908_006927 [Rhodotorula pacifica]|uniref:alpha,alpha-trehalase ATH1 n=1 Tax=Rhodotorula pacifica TaxID=1495444 RepID=UPI003181753B